MALKFSKLFSFYVFANVLKLSLLALVVSYAAFGEVSRASGFAEVGDLRLKCAFVDFFKVLLETCSAFLFEEKGVSVFKIPIFIHLCSKNLRLSIHFRSLRHLFLLLLRSLLQKLLFQNRLNLSFMKSQSVHRLPYQFLF